jgi:prepilin-type processing-associated H-X9-DG protein
MAGDYGWKPVPTPYTFGADDGHASPDWVKAQNGWIDISPRDFVETTPAPGCYDPRHWDPDSGIGRDFYGGGTTYGFVDGHVKFMKIVDSVGARDGALPKRPWSANNAYNHWNPDAPQPRKP